MNFVGCFAWCYFPLVVKVLQIGDFNAHNKMNEHTTELESLKTLFYTTHPLCERRGPVLVAVPSVRYICRKSGVSVGNSTTPQCTHNAITLSFSFFSP